ncbi:MAG: 30S ribosomal protein S12 methylthiotransferase RimO [Oscillospiraceae bacterium]|nr:30S ribosomal protein S12 methylthiotransferase RimO [Oscillospiraceae bacterium]
MTYTVSMISLGCAKNQVNAEQMLFRLQEAGYRVTGDPDGADLVVINTCGFIDSAKEEAISHILQMAELKAEGRVGKILVTGCLAQRYQHEILEELPEVDGILGTGSYYNIAAAAAQVLAGNAVEEYGDIDAPVDETGRILTTPEHYAYLTIAEGCDNRCSYCIIPKLRGKYRSREMDDILYEARTLAANGVKELIVVAQDTSRYGMDLEGRHMLPDLLHELCKIDGIRWIRLHYLYPEDTTDEIIDAVASEPKIVKYLDIPIQHINNLILKKMNRRGTKEVITELFRKLRERVPGIVIRTSLIAGLPYEDDDAFTELCEFLKEMKLERVGAFVFSPQDGTAAAKMEYPPREVAQRRAELLEELQARIMDAYNDALIGETLEVLCEGFDPESGLYYGRSFADSPDIDGKVWFTSENGARIGEFYRIFIGEIADGDPVGAAIPED